jgi:hypothetical protein
MGAFLLALAFVGLIVAVEECFHGRRKTEATWD